MESIINYTKATTESDLVGILKLQKDNISSNLAKEEIESQGFVTVQHSHQDLKQLNDIEKHIIAKEHDKVIAYLLAMTRVSRHDIPVLIPMFEIFDTVRFAGKPVSAYNYIVVGQVCVDKNFRGRGVTDQCYSLYKDAYKGRYDFAVTEIAVSNNRSLNAHKRIGFTEIHRYLAPDETVWSVVLWNWNYIN